MTARIAPLFAAEAMQHLVKGMFIAIAVLTAFQLFSTASSTLSFYAISPDQPLALFS